MYKNSNAIKVLLVTQAIVEIGLGMFPLLFPHFAANLSGSTLTEPEGVLLSRVAGASLISMGWLSWMLRNSIKSVVQKQVLQMFALFQVAVFVILLYGQLIGARSTAGWLGVCIHFCFAVSFIGVLLRYTDKKESSLLLINYVN